MTDFQTHISIRIAKEDFTVQYLEDVECIHDNLVNARPAFFTYDTETTGLHIKKDKPFLAAICFQNMVYVFPSTQKNLDHLVGWSRLVQNVYAHNTTYDMHMTANICGDNMVLSINNWADLMGLCRLTFEAISTRDGGDSLKLKMIGTKYVDSQANVWEKQVKAWLKARESENSKVLTAILKAHGFTRKDFDAAMKQEALTFEMKEIYTTWREEYPAPNYQDVPMNIMLPYVAVDVILERILVDKCLPVVKHREQMPTFEREMKLLPVVWKMERPGIKVDRPYLEETNQKLGVYIKVLYNELWELTEIPGLSVNQHKVINELMNDLNGSTGKKTDKKGLKKFKGDKIGRIATLISRLRRLEKWKETYVERILTVSEHDGRFYTSMNPYNPVSGRFSGDAQQFPKDPIYTEEGYEYEKATGHQPPQEMVLYHPRKAFLGRIYYLDYSQVELRVQGHYTIPFGGDKNLCRAYMPFECIHYKTKEVFRFDTFQERKRWIEVREGAPISKHWEKQLEEGWSVWINPDTNSPWIPTDVHGSTTTKALITMGFDPTSMSEEEFKWWRSKGKQFNFMRNYGGGDAMAADTLEIELEQAKAMNKGYSDAFPLVVTYQNEVIVVMRNRGYAINLCGRRYYVSDWNKHYKVANYLIQGSCADLLKEKMIEIDQFLTDNNLNDKLRMILCVHDELQFEELVPGQGWAIAKIKGIMEDIPDVLVPIVAEVEFTETDWASKKKLLNVA